jgi:hypothetical protein
MTRDAVLVTLILRTESKCVFCSTRFEKPLCLNADHVLNPVWLAHCSTTHGYEPEDIFMMLNAVTA